MTVKDFCVRAQSGIAKLMFAFVLVGCTSTPHRPYVKATSPSSECKTVVLDTNPKQTTPEVSVNPKYTLHFLEFDDQGWPYANTTAGEPNSTWSPGHQIDCAIADLAQKLEQGQQVRAFVYVHGWHHSADDNDRDLKRFRVLLSDYAKDASREVIGFYIGWEGDTIDLPLLKDLTFWGRKNAAHHVAEGSVREFFARMKGLRNHWNQPDRPNRLQSANCGKEIALTEGKGCALRTVMIGHSFGAWILYASASPYLLETLSGTADLPDDATLPVTARERGIADLVLLLNPAFEASRYEAVHRAAKRYNPTKYETPLLVSVTSVADGATKTAFPLARFFNSILQYPATTDAESIAMKRTHGHIDEYLTHELTLDDNRANSAMDPVGRCLDLNKNQSSRQDMRTKFFNGAKNSDGKMVLNGKWKREMCGGLTLQSLGKPEVNPYSIVWNVRTYANVIPDHNSINTRPLLDFVEQIYGDIGTAPRLPLLH